MPELHDEAEEQRNRIAAGRAILGRPLLAPDFWATQQLKKQFAGALYRTHGRAVYAGVRDEGHRYAVAPRRAKNKVASRSRRVNRRRSS